MITKLRLLEGVSLDPYYNLAVEEQLLDTVEEGCCILYLWQNGHTVVIGKNQNAFAECRTGLLEAEGGLLARRLSGGGAVYHDLGNLNFTFLMASADYDLEKQLQVILTACRALGVPAERSGRNDVLADGRKFSGNAFYRGSRNSYHHGTLMVDADLEKLGRYLSPSRAKLQAKGVRSVRSRVVNLREFVPELTVDALKRTLTEAFSAVYGLPVAPMKMSEPDAAAVERLRQRNSSWDWNFGSVPVCTARLENRFPWGGVELLLEVSQGLVQTCRVYSDAMDHALPVVLEQALTGCRFTTGALCEALSAVEEPYRGDLAAFLQAQEL